MSKALKKCPFCGKEEIAKVVTDEYMRTMYIDYDVDDDFQGNDGYYVLCLFSNGGCGANSGWGMTDNEAIKKWNKREGCKDV